MNTHEIIAFKLKKKMKALGITQEDIARELGYAKQCTISKKINHGEFSVAELGQICDLLGLEVTITEKKGNNE